MYLSPTSQCNLTSNHTYPSEKVCTFERNMYGETLHCPSSEHLMYCDDHQCPGMFKCQDSYCIPSNMVCDGVPDCPYRQDEKHCKDVVCVGGLVCKGSRRCVHPHNICDGIVHCAEYQDDETDCFLEKCSTNCTCVANIMTCTGHSSYIQITNNIKMLYVYRMRIYYDSNDKRILTVVVVKLKEIALGEIVGFLKGMSLLKELHLIKTDIRVLHRRMFQNCRSLKILFFQENPIAVVQEEAFLGVNHIHELFLNGFQIKAVANNAFKGSSNIFALNLGSNYIRHLGRNMLSYLTTLIYLNLTSNPIISIEIEEYRFSPINSQLVIHIDANEHCCYFTGAQCFYRSSPSNTLRYMAKPRCNLPMKDIRLSAIQCAAGLINLAILLATLLRYKSYFTQTVTRNLTLVAILVSDAIGVIFLLMIASSGIPYSYTDVFALRKWLSGTVCHLATTSLVVQQFMVGMSWTVLVVLNLKAVKYPLLKTKIRPIHIASLLVSGLIVVYSVMFSLRHSSTSPSSLCHFFSISRGQMSSNWSIYLALALLACYFVCTIIVIGFKYYKMYVITNASAKLANVKNHNKAGKLKYKVTMIFITKSLLWLLNIVELMLPLFTIVNQYTAAYIYIATMFLSQITNIYIVLVF